MTHFYVGTISHLLTYTHTLQLRLICLSHICPCLYTEAAKPCSAKTAYETLPCRRVDDTADSLLSAVAYETLPCRRVILSLSHVICPCLYTEAAKPCSAKTASCH
eukprot:TRINITY_DN2815_c0_g1_i5.p1 TRINITY_DN2815_c0_g1~~TRINITY_DN2815_c0_g1_i5.p1  ORF type:complete len:105 (-),score=6.28 TRINITY_DN2815_c0_g1_i5:81-395(-)